MIEGRVGPKRWIMALRAVRREASRGVVRISCRVVLRHVATITRVRCVVVIPIVTLVTTHRRMRVR